MMKSKTLQERLKEIREDADMTQEEVGRYLGTTKQYYQKYEKGAHPLPVRHLAALAELYDTSTDYLLGRTNIRKPYPAVKAKIKKG